MAGFKWNTTANGNELDGGVNIADNTGGIVVEYVASNSASATSANGYSTFSLPSGTAQNTADMLFIVRNSSNEIVYWYLDNNSVGNATGDDSFTITSGTLASGSYTITAYVMNAASATTDSSGNGTNVPLSSTYTEVSGSSYAFTVDLSAPSAPTIALASDTALADLITSNGTIDVSGLEANATYQYSTNGGADWTTGSGTSFTVTGDGAKTVLVRQVDAAGNPSSSNASLTFTLDTAAAAPAIALALDSGTNTSDKITNNGTVVVTGETGAAISYSLDQITWSATAPTGLADGEHTVYAKQVDVAGNESGASSLTFTVDTTVADATNTLPLVGSDLLFSGTVEAGSTAVTVRIKDVGGTVVFEKILSTSAQGNNTPELNTATGVWSFSAAGDPDFDGVTADYTLEVDTTDRAGNTATDALAVTIDTNAPPVPSVSQFSFAPTDSKWKHDVAVLGVVGDVYLTTDADATVSAWILQAQTKTQEQTATHLGNGSFKWSPTIDGAAINLSTLYQKLEFQLAAVDAAGNAITVGGGPNPKPAIVNCVYGAHAVETVTDPSSGLISVINDINDNLVGSNDYDDLIVGYNGNDNINGQGGNDWLYGGQGDDVIQGNQGNDEIVGGTQRDVMSGGAGNDRFIYSRINESNTSALSRDQITDFTITAGVDADVINMSEISKSLMQLTFTSTAYGANGKASGQANVAVGKVWFANDGMLYANTSGNSSADFAIQLRNPADFASPSTEMDAVRSYLATGGGLIL